jgi:hypothetical protein
MLDHRGRKRAIDYERLPALLWLGKRRCVGCAVGTISVRGTEGRPRAPEEASVVLYTVQYVPYW